MKIDQVTSEDFINAGVHPFAYAGIKIQRKSDRIITAVCDHYSVPLYLLKAKTRRRTIVQARQIAMYILKYQTNMSLKSIGMEFGGRDHSTVIHACQTVRDLSDTDKDYRAKLEKLLSLL